MSRFPLAAAVALALTALPANAQALDLYFAPKLDVNPLSATTFEVIEKGGVGPRGIWCAAADYAINDLGKQRGRIYIVTPRGPAQTEAGAKGVAFSTQDPGIAANTGYSVTTDVAGANLLVFHAEQFCNDNIIEPGDVIP
ncbi:hypothetical protein SAMN05444149_103335 [Pseudosulfitobacter pseudonitzschiae]|uniref:Uncharacterized protein n=1 Tax=Pseudosulfitobacter pseudonitzschiae TaxID=1402135 RepID=A0A073J2C9_9RHOB|nr:hypothetical protein [Pseudosulfitobacter pseudonitzschiae]KEJ96763.1 hypothetical protein SUH3_15520 [Pseudosulfitobacter pseudonitzschiae]QKS07783.1 hypothetical protein HT745_04410 [Pseudosulfitobacter pseudonitzschiae]SHF25185.1 hypothetical protein SAMN05444149_103335 [Pseudosulfitobacter pseudonitzschiae]